MAISSLNPSSKADRTVWPLHSCAKCPVHGPLLGDAGNGDNSPVRRLTITP